MSRRGVVGVVLAVVSIVLTGCGTGGTASSRTLQWWVSPDGVDARALAESCTADSPYRIELVELPADLDQQRVEIVRRMSAGDDTIDILSLDGSLLAEIAAAGYLAEVPSELETTFTEGVLPQAVEAATVDDELVAAPWHIDPQLLWYRGTAAERAGLDTTRPIGWDDLLAGAERLGTTLQIDDPDGDGLAEWVRALVAGAGGTILDGAGRDPEVGLATDAGEVAAGIVQFYAGAGVGPGPSPEARIEFAGARGGFLLASSAVLTDPALSTVRADLNAVPYPVVDTESVAPLSTVALAVSDDAADPDLAFEAVTCLTTQESQQQMMIDSGHGAARAAVYEATEVKSAIVSSDVMLKAVATGVTVPVTPYWQRARLALENTWSPIDEVSPSTTPTESQRAVRARVAGGLS